VSGDGRAGVSRSGTDRRGGTQRRGVERRARRRGQRPTLAPWVGASQGGRHARCRPLAVVCERQGTAKCERQPSAWRPAWLAGVGVGVRIAERGIGGCCWVLRSQERERQGANAIPRGCRQAGGGVVAFEVPWRVRWRVPCAHRRTSPGASAMRARRRGFNLRLRSSIACERRRT
jgi:hypothetical protein